MGNLRIWWNPQIGAKIPLFYVPVDTVEEAKRVMDTLAAYDLYQYSNHIKPDYCNIGGLEMFDEEEGWVDWYFEDTEHDLYYEDIDEYLHDFSKNNG